ncbi:MAG: SprT-like domain-containing protein [Pseudomonadota bacterium]
MPQPTYTKPLLAALIGSGLLATASARERAAEPVSAARTYEGARSTFNLPSKAEAKTRTRDLFRLVDALDKGYRQFELAPPYPQIRIVDKNHEAFPDYGLAVAMRSASGREYIYFNRSYLEKTSDLDSTVMHELAHIKTWRMHGIHVREHGKEYRTICRAATDRDHCSSKDRNRDLFW